MTTAEHNSQLTRGGVLIAGRYRLFRWLGLGAAGEVWVARDERLGRDVAVKLIPRDLLAGPDDADRFTREAIAVAGINHPNVVTVYDQGDHLRQHFLVMELVTGCTLDELRAGRPMPIGAALAITVQVARALHAAHTAGVVHQDVKPANIMITHDGVVKVVDFGIAGFQRPPGSTLQFPPGGTLGTPAYTAPERITGGPVDPRSDLYSLGCLMYVLLTGRPPFPAEDIFGVLHRHLHDEPAPTRRQRPEIAEEIDQLVLWLLAKEPAGRPADVSVVVRRLESLAVAYPTGSEPGAEPNPAAGPESGPQYGPLYDPQPSTDSTTTRAIGVVRSRRKPPAAGRTPTPPRPRRRHPGLLAVALLVIGLILTAAISRHYGGAEAGAVGSMGTAAPSGSPGDPMAQVPTPAPTAASGSASAASGAPPPTATPTASQSQAAGTASTGGSAQSSTLTVTPIGPISPFLRYTEVAPGTGCVTLAPGQYECTVNRSAGAPVFRPGSMDRTGTVGPGSQPFYCQSPGAEYSSDGSTNRWWAWTESDQGDWGWVSAVDLAGGANDQPEPGLPYCES